MTTRCLMPGCANDAKDKRLCDNHTVAGADLRIPVMLISDLPEIYKAMLSSDSFTALDVLDKIDPAFARSDNDEYKERRLNDMGKLLRTLRANCYVVKVGQRSRYTLFQIKNRGRWSQQVAVMVAEEVVPKPDDVTARETAKRAAQDLIGVEKKTSVEEILLSHAKCLSDHTRELLSLRKENETLRQQVADLTTRIAETIVGQTVSGHDCPILKLRKGRAEVLRGSHG